MVGCQINKQKIESLLNAASEVNQNIQLTNDHFSKYNVTVSTPKTVGNYAVDSTIHNWKAKSPPQCLTTDRGTEKQLKTDFSKCCNLFCSFNVMELSTVVCFFFIIDCTYCILTWKPCFLF